MEPKRKREEVISVIHSTNGLEPCCVPSAVWGIGTEELDAGPPRWEHTELPVSLRPDTPALNLRHKHRLSSTAGEPTAFLLGW